ncbi:hypothetical protein GGQ80_000798 [Sphingomonas jinjuensis]|uniref:Prohead serine protease domain-containing protein n=1 Tax=Sphingomonas jinjuensis TaxID=535907 RepID=A0A840F4U6_9SPHN|nr:HK97 family phage prohead protease [Sphingomonas jinjuensis]MBB4152910.1 hypothetical protein [Sphingomonas jinjuensis]
MPKPKQPDGRERRVLDRPLEVRELATGANGRTVRGYAAVFDTQTDIGGCWVETIAPGAFTATLRSADVLALYSHQTDRVLGRTGAGTMRLAEDERGLAVEIDLPDTTDGRDLAVLIARGDVKGMSFGFIARRQVWDETVEPVRRTLEEVELLEVTITAFPQYPETEIGLRSLEHARAERREHDRAGGSARLARKAATDHAARRLY